MFTDYKKNVEFAGHCTMEQLVDAIAETRATLDLLERVKKGRIKAGEQTPEMIRRREKKAQKQAQNVITKTEPVAVVEAEPVSIPVNTVSQVEPGVAYENEMEKSG